MITDYFTVDTIDMVLKLTVALFLGMSLGIERALAGKTAGMRTYGLVTLGSTLFVIVGVVASGGFASTDALRESVRFSEGILPGIGFIGAGLIIFRGSKVSGVTTAAGIWVAAGIGASIGYGLYMLAVATTVFVLIIFTGFWYVENKVKSLAHFSNED
ncbi:MAG: MgtC/SapB family protein [Candidatus Yonathbacteria bacterium]|nr:MgtC/SapB family protein [Candidatus Yonathbacteria bacterium]